MTWQEELRKLDESLASGNLSADEYRTRRDQILSSAVSSPDQGEGSAGGDGNADSTQIIAPLSDQQQQNPQQGQPPQQGGDATQVVSSTDAGPERTQAVQPWQAQHPQAHPPQQGGQYPGSPSGGFPQPHQAQQSPAGGFPQPQSSPPGGFAAPQNQQQQQQPWNAPQHDSSPPWGGGEFPPLTPQGSPEWGVSQGPESFDEPEPSGKGRKALFSALAVVLVAGIGTAVYFLFIAGGDSQTAQPPAPSTSQQQPPPQTPTSTPLPKPPPPKEEPADNEAALIDPPGEERPGAGPFDYEVLESNSDMLPPTVIDALGDTDMGDGLLKTTVDDDITFGLYSIEVGSEDDAVSVANEYGVAQQEGGIPAQRKLSMQGVQVFGAGASEYTVLRAVYTLYDRVVIVEAFSEDEDVESVFTDLLDEQVNHAPPSHTES
ncbi:flagellar basal body protein FliL [Saccharomonospora piscinae]|uniref:flagellar basal body protein FliL n=1 Tax=Saccharomonospora piscinae TaxID=687388 RepID=UPI000463A4A8|nr:flagellar basal body protein FliL [Saccharomonospora piscinae]